MPRKMLSDGSYGIRINAFTAENAKGKQAFLQDARLFLFEAAELLAQAGLTENRISTNLGGIALSGDVYARFWAKESPDEMIYCTIGTLRIGSFRQDAVSIKARIEMCAPGRSVEYGESTWLSADLDCRNLVTELLKIGGYSMAGILSAKHAKAVLSLQPPLQGADNNGSI